MIIEPLPQLEVDVRMAANILSNVAVLAACDLPRREISAVVANFSIPLQCFFHLVAGGRESYITNPRLRQACRVSKTAYSNAQGLVIPACKIMAHIGRGKGYRSLPPVQLM